MRCRLAYVRPWSLAETLEFDEDLGRRRQRTRQGMGCRPRCRQSRPKQLLKSGRTPQQGGWQEVCRSGGAAPTSRLMHTTRFMPRPGGAIPPSTANCTSPYPGLVDSVPTDPRSKTGSRLLSAHPEPQKRCASDVASALWLHGADTTGRRLASRLPYRTGV